MSASALWLIFSCWTPGLLPKTVPPNGLLPQGRKLEGSIPSCAAPPMPLPILGIHTLPGLCRHHLRLSPHCRCELTAELCEWVSQPHSLLGRHSIHKNLLSSYTPHTQHKVRKRRGLDSPGHLPPEPLRSLVFVINSKWLKCIFTFLSMCQCLIFPDVFFY